jgi:hypothetical protein
MVIPIVGEIACKERIILVTSAVYLAEQNDVRGRD